MEKGSIITALQIAGHFPSLKRILNVSFKVVHIQFTSGLGHRKLFITLGAFFSLEMLIATCMHCGIYSLYMVMKLG
jgi:hypothetical protein